MQLFELAREELLCSNDDRDHPYCVFWLATFGDYPELRTVICRKVEDNLSILFYTDPRSPKVQQIKDNGRVSAIFWNPDRGLQVRMRAHAYPIENIRMLYPQLLHEIKNSPLKKDFTAKRAPGTVVEEPYEAQYGSEVHFEAIRIVPEIIDVLQVNMEGPHLRYQYTLENGEWKEARLVP